MSDPRSSVLITVDELAEQISGQSRLVVLDVSDNLETAPLERPVIPGAIAVSLASDVSGPPTKQGGKRPLPDPDALQENLRRWGIDADSVVGRLWTTRRGRRQDARGGRCAGPDIEAFGFWTVAWPHGKRRGRPRQISPVHPAGWR